MAVALASLNAGNTKGGSITVQLTSCLTSLDHSVLQIKMKIVSCHTADSKPVKQEVNGTVLLALYCSLLNAILLLENVLALATAPYFGIAVSYSCNLLKTLAHGLKAT